MNKPVRASSFYLLDIRLYRVYILLGYCDAATIARIKNQVTLSEIIIQKIKSEGPIPFRDFMEMALYYPGLGYYTSPQNKIGKDGDYYTSTNLTPVFGAMIAKQIEEMWCLSGEENFTIVEYGAGTGFLCHDILSSLKNNKRFYDRLNYCIIEKSETMRDKEKKFLNPLFDKITWLNSINDIPKITGCILSNELVDNFAVHRVVMEDELMEVFVDYKNGFVELLQPAGQALKDYLSRLNIFLPKGFCTEINMEAAGWIKEIAQALKKGYVITIDYGYPSSELYQVSKRQGTMVCYHKHTINDDPYHDIGGQDITTHINFSALSHWGNENGLYTCGFTDQAHFLLALGFNDYLNNVIAQEHDVYLAYRKKTFLTHTLLAEMGSKFKVLIQRKGIAEHELAGLRMCKHDHSLFNHDFDPLMR